MISVYPTGNRQDQENCPEHDASDGFLAFFLPKPRMPYTMLAIEIGTPMTGKIQATVEAIP